MKNRTACIVSCSVCFALLGCAGEQQRFTGFLSEYSILKPHPTVDGGLVYWNRATDPEHLRAVLVEPVEVHFADHNDQQRTRPEEVAAFRTFVKDELTAALSTHLAITTEPGPSVFRCRLQVANLRLTRAIDNPPPPWPAREFALGTANIETDVRDSLSGELVAAYASPRGRAGRHTTYFLTSPPDRWEAAKTAVRSQIVTWSDHAFQRVAPESGRNTDGVTHALVSHPIPWRSAHDQRKVK